MRQEKLFRELYDDVRILKDVEIDFSMDTSQVEKKVDRWLRICVSKTIFPFYLPILAVIIAVFVWAMVEHFWK